MNHCIIFTGDQSVTVTVLEDVDQIYENWQNPKIKNTEHQYIIDALA